MEFELSPDGLTARWAATPLFPRRCFLLCPDPAARDLYADDARPGGLRGDSGVDLRFAEDADIPPAAATGGLPAMVGLKVRARSLAVKGGAECECLPYEIRPRSSIAKTPLSLANSVGTIDRGYTGELKLAIRNHAAEPFRVKRGESLFQLVRPDLAPAAVFVVAPDCPAFQEGATLRGAGGFGSTGAGGAGAD